MSSSSMPDDELGIESQFPDIRRGINGTIVPRREGPGRLSTLWNCPEDRCDPLTYSDTDDDSDSDSDSELDAAVHAVLTGSENNSKEGKNDDSGCGIADELHVPVVESACRNANGVSTACDTEHATAMKKSASNIYTPSTTITSTSADETKSIEAKSDETAINVNSCSLNMNMPMPMPMPMNMNVNMPISMGLCLDGPSSLRRRLEPPVQRYQMGIGYAKVRVEDHTVYIHHCAHGLPVAEGYSVSLFRTVALAAEESWPLKELCALAMKWRSDREQRGTRARPGRFSLFRWKSNGGGCGDWCSQGYKRSRPARSVILPDGQLEAIVRDIKDFVARDTKAWYQAHGLPHRRSYLFHGPPGSGKSSTVKMIAGLFRLNACFLGFTSDDFCNQMLQDALTSLPRRALLVLEDVDVLFNEDRKSEATQALTFSGMLNALDGLISVDGIITIFTTNHIDKLDPALIRGGRVDRRFEFGHPTSAQMITLFKSFYEQAPDSLAQRFAELVLARPEEEARSIATLQQHFIYTRNRTAEESVGLVNQFFSEFYPKGARSTNPLYI